jgi:hypothetical protein
MSGPEKVEAAIEAAIMKRMSSDMFDPADLSVLGDYISFCCEGTKYYAVPWVFCSTLEVNTLEICRNGTSLTNLAARVVSPRCICS